MTKVDAGLFHRKAPRKTLTFKSITNSTMEPGPCASPFLLASPANSSGTAATTAPHRPSSPPPALVTFFGGAPPPVIPKSCDERPTRSACPESYRDESASLPGLLSFLAPVTRHCLSPLPVAPSSAAQNRPTAPDECHPAALLALSTVDNLRCIDIR